MAVIQGWEPDRLFRHFEEISAIPRGSGNERAISDFLMAFARERGLEAHQDQVWNVVIKKPASPGGEGLPPVMLQGHLDMVCEKNAAVSHDFSSEGIRLVQEDGWLRADGTTLGADNGVAVALMMALLEDAELRHPPLECVFTVQEETGLTGAIQLDPALVSARTMINLDSEDEGVATVSCAGGMRVNLSRDCCWEPAGPDGLRIELRGLLGGHSGTDIHLERGNANKLMGRLLARLEEEGIPFRIAHIQGGSKDNAIPRECDCLLALEQPEDESRCLSILREEEESIRVELPGEPDFSLRGISQVPERAMSREVSRSLTRLLLLAPNGPLSRNLRAGGFIVASVNLGVVSVRGEQVKVTFAPRSSAASLQEQTRRSLIFLGETLGFQAEITSRYPGWSYREDSPIRELFRDCYRELTGGELRCEAIHAGLECGLFSEKLPGLDAIAVGPQVNHCHTPDEELDLASCQRIYRLLSAVLSRLAQG